VYDRDTGEWHYMLSGGGFEPKSFVLGGPGWLPIQADYDGDGQADIVLYNQATGEWGVLLSYNQYGGPLYFNFGGPDWVVVTGDYDNDGKTDPTIYNETYGVWICLLSSQGHYPFYVALGGPGYAAVSGDYDGDGRSDPGIWQRANGQWLILLSSLEYLLQTIHVDTKGDGPLVPSPADYDGDRKTDPAVFAYQAPSFLGKHYVCGWHLLSSRQNFRQIASAYFLGREGDESIAAPAPGDYDGDGKADFAIVWPYFENAHVMWRNWWSTHFGESDHFTIIRWSGTDVHPVQR